MGAFGGISVKPQLGLGNGSWAYLNIQQGINWVAGVIPRPWMRKLEENKITPQQRKEIKKKQEASGVEVVKVTQKKIGPGVHVSEAHLFSNSGNEQNCTVDQ